MNAHFWANPRKRQTEGADASCHEYRIPIAYNLVPLQAAGLTESSQRGPQTPTVTHLSRAKWEYPAGSCASRRLVRGIAFVCTSGRLRLRLSLQEWFNLPHLIFGFQKP